MTQLSSIQRISGSMIASAIGGALGDPSGQISDDTQMTLFTAEGLILSKVRADYKDVDPVEPVFHSLLRWLYTQQVHMLGDMINTYGTCNIVDGILMGHKELFVLRNPSDTCLETLSRGTMGTLDYPASQSAGKGALVRTLPVGLSFGDAEKAFDLGCKTAAITHGHKDAVLSSGYFAALISQLAIGQPFPWAMTSALTLLQNHSGHEVLVEKIELAVTLSATCEDSETIDENFKDPTAADTLAAGVYCALCHPKDLNRGLFLSVDHSGNCDETGAVTGAILGAINGLDVVPYELLATLELKDLILEVSRDLFDRFYENRESEAK